MDVSTDGGNTWAEYRRLRGDQDPEEVWISKTLEVDAPSQIRIRFRGNMSSATEDAYVDAVRIEQL